MAVKLIAIVSINPEIALCAGGRHGGLIEALYLAISRRLSRKGCIKRLIDAQNKWSIERVVNRRGGGCNRSRVLTIPSVDRSILFDQSQRNLTVEPDFLTDHAERLIRPAKSLDAKTHNVANLTAKRLGVEGGAEHAAILVALKNLLGDPLRSPTILDIGQVNGGGAFDAVRRGEANFRIVHHLIKAGVRRIDIAATGHIIVFCQAASLLPIELAKHVRFVQIKHIFAKVILHDRQRQLARIVAERTVHGHEEGINNVHAAVCV